MTARKNGKKEEPTKELTVQDRAIAALGLEGIKQKLTDLAAGSAKLVEVTNDDSYKQIHAARMVLKNQRVAITKQGKAARDDATLFSRALIAEEKKLIDIIAPEEERLKGLQMEFDQRAERERAEKIAAEVARVESIKERITEIRGAVSAVTSMGLPSAEKVSEFIGDVEKLVVDNSFDEFEQQGHEAKASTLALLREHLASAQQRQAEEQRIAEERKELEELRAADQKRQAKEQAKRAAEEAEARKIREAEEEEKRKELEAQRKEQAEEQKKLDAENKRIADERAELEAEQKAEADRKAEELRSLEQARAAAKRSEFPGEEAIVDLLVKHFGVTVTVATGWLSKIREAA